MAALQGTCVILWLRAIGLEGFVGHVARYQGNLLGAQDRSWLLLTIQFGRTVITLQVPPLTHGPRASSVQIDSITAACAFAQHMVNTAEFFHDKLISLLWQYIFDSAWAVQTRSSFYVLLHSSRNSSRCSPLLSLASPPRPRFCAEDLPKPCWSTLRRGQPSTCY